MVAHLCHTALMLHCPFVSNIETTTQEIRSSVPYSVDASLSVRVSLCVCRYILLNHTSTHHACSFCLVSSLCHNDDDSASYTLVSSPYLWASLDTYLWGLILKYGAMLESLLNVPLWGIRTGEARFLRIVFILTLGWGRGQPLPQFSLRFNGF